MDAADVPRHPGVDAAAVRRADVCDDRPLRTHRAGRPTIGASPGNSRRDVTRRETPDDDVVTRTIKVSRPATQRHCARPHCVKSEIG